MSTRARFATCGFLLLSCTLLSCTLPSQAGMPAAPRLADRGVVLHVLTAITTQRGDGMGDLAAALRKNNESGTSGGPMTLADGTALSKWSIFERDGTLTHLTSTVAPPDCIALSEVVRKTYARYAFTHDGGFAFEAIGVHGGFWAQDHDRTCLGHLALSRAGPAEPQSNEAERASGRISFSRVLDSTLSVDSKALQEASDTLERLRAARRSGAAPSNTAAPTDGDAELLRLRSYATGGKVFGLTLELAAKPCFPIELAAARTDARAFPRQEGATVYEARPPGGFTTIYPNALDRACVGGFIHYRQ